MAKEMSLCVMPFQSARVETFAGCKLPTPDRYEDSENVLLLQPRPGLVPDLPY